jgi:hypothetical protein
MTAQFKESCKLPIASAIGAEIGTVVSMNDTQCEVSFPIYGASFSLGLENFTIKQGDAPIDIRPANPNDGSTWDGSKWVAPTPLQLTVEQQKKLGKDYNGFMVPLTKDTQDTIVAVAVAFQMGAITYTVMQFENGVSMPIAVTEFTSFAVWFTTERNKFFAS